jgi:hypothetical protein
VHHALQRRRVDVQPRGVAVTTAVQLLNFRPRHTGLELAALALARVGGGAWRRRISGGVRRHRHGLHGGARATEERRGAARE